MEMIPIILDIACILVAVIFIALGIWRGFIKSLIRSAKFILAVVLAYFLGSYLGAFFKDAFVSDMVYTPVHSWIDSAYGAATEGIDVEEILTAIPEYALTDEVKASIEAAANEESGAALVETVAHSIADPVADGISNVLGYVAVFLLSLIVLSILAWLLTKLADGLAVIGAVNRILGGVWGAVTAFLLLTVLSSLIKLFWATDPVYTDTVIVKLIGDSGILETLGFLNIGNII